MANIGSLVAQIKADTQDLKRGMTETKSAVRGAETGVNNSIGGMKFAAIGVAATAAAGVVAFQMGRLVKSSLGAASDLEEATSKFEAVFSNLAPTDVMVDIAVGVEVDKTDIEGKFETAFADIKTPEVDVNKLTISIDDVNDWVEVLTDGYAMSTKEARTYLGAVQDLLVPMGVLPQEAAVLSNEIVKLSADLGSFNNLPTEKVMLDIQSALVGNFETMKKYGVVLNVARTEQEALSSGLAKTKEEALDPAIRAQAAYNLIVKGSAAAIGDMERTMDGYANSLKGAEAAASEVSAGLGKDLLPLVAELFREFTAFSKSEDFKAALSELSKDLAEVGRFVIAIVKHMPKLISLALDLKNIIFKLPGETIYDVIHAGVLSATKGTDKLHDAEKSRAKGELARRRSANKTWVDARANITLTSKEIDELSTGFEDAGRVEKKFVGDTVQGAAKMKAALEQANKAKMKALAESEKAAAEAAQKEIDALEKLAAEALKAYEKIVAARMKARDDEFEIVEDIESRIRKERNDSFVIMIGDMNQHTADLKKAMEDWAREADVINDDIETANKLSAEQMESDFSSEFLNAVKEGLEGSVKTGGEWPTWQEGVETIAKSAATGAKSALSKSFFVAIKGDMDGFEVIWQSFLDGLLKSFTDTVADLVVGELVEFGGNLLFDLVTSSADEGRWKVKEDQVIKVHEGEMILPKEVSETLRSAFSGAGPALSPSLDAATASTAAAAAFGKGAGQSFGLSAAASLVSMGTVPIAAIPLMGLKAVLSGVLGAGQVTSSAQELASNLVASAAAVGGFAIGGPVGGILGAILGAFFGPQIAAALGFTVPSSEESFAAAQGMFGGFTGMEGVAEGLAGLSEAQSLGALFDRGGKIMGQGQHALVVGKPGEVVLTEKMVERIVEALSGSGRGAEQINVFVGNEQLDARIERVSSNRIVRANKRDMGTSRQFLGF